MLGATMKRFFVRIDLSTYLETSMQRDSSLANLVAKNGR